MEKQPIGAMVTGGIITLVLSAATAAAFFMALVLALNGFMGQERAVNASFGTYTVLAAGAALVMTALCVFSTSFLARRFKWNALLAMVLSVVVSGLGAVVLHFLCLIAATIVASTLRTGR